MLPDIMCCRGKGLIRPKGNDKELEEHIVTFNRGPPGSSILLLGSVPAANTFHKCHRERWRGPVSAFNSHICWLILLQYCNNALLNQKEPYARSMSCWLSGDCSGDVLQQCSAGDHIT
jgi:hypothetical protein